jgi:hypothetical protein
MHITGIIDSEGPQWLAPYISTIVISTTIQIQDFRDEAGDRMQGHMTLAILMPEFCRRITSLLIMCWSLGLVRFWGEGLNPRLVTSILVLGTFISLRVMLLRSQYQDKVTLRWYMVRLVVKIVILLTNAQPEVMAHDRPAPSVLDLMRFRPIESSSFIMSAEAPACGGT